MRNKFTLKALILSTSTAIGLGAIGVKNIINNETGDLGLAMPACFSISGISSNKFLPFNPINDLDLSEILGLTGNSAFDLIKMINYFQTIQLIVSYFIAYNLFLYIIDFTFVINKLNKMFPGSTGQKYILILSNYISKIKKVSLIFLTIFIILNLICAYINSNTIEFVYTNFDSIIELYLKNKNN
jgi:small-conductance mechanosensitive channel